MPVLNQINQLLPGCNGLRDGCRKRLLGRYGSDALAVVNSAKAGEMDIIPGTDTLWVELRWAARSEGVCHLEDLLLRRTRLGLILPEGGEFILPVVKQICSAELHWNDDRWQQEVAQYRSLITCCYSLPPSLSIPDWRAMLSDVRIKRKLQAIDDHRKLVRNSSMLASVVLLSAAIIALIWRQNKTAKNIYSLNQVSDETKNPCEGLFAGIDSQWRNIIWENGFLKSVNK